MVGGSIAISLEMSAKLEPKRQGQISQAWGTKGGGIIKHKTERMRRRTSIL